MKTKKNWRGGQSKDLIIYVLDENQEKQRGGGVCLPLEKN